MTIDPSPESWEPGRNPKSPLDRFLDEYNTAVFGIAVSELAIDGGEVEILGRTFSDSKTVSIFGVGQIIFIDDLETGHRLLGVYGRSGMTHADEQSSTVGLFAVDLETNQVSKFQNNPDQTVQLPATDQELTLAGGMLAAANDVHRRLDSLRLPEEVQTNLRGITEFFLDGRSGHPLVKISSFSGEFGSSIDTTIHDSGLHITISRVFVRSGNYLDYIHLHGDALPPYLQDRAIQIDNDTGLNPIWQHVPHHFQEEKLVYKGQKPIKKDDDVDKLSVSPQKIEYLRSEDGTLIAELLAGYKSAEGFEITPENETHIPPTESLRGKLHQQLRDILDGTLKIDGIELGEINNGEEQIFRTAVLKKRGIARDRLDLEVRAHRSGSINVELHGVDVDEGINNLEFIFDFPDNSMRVRHSLEDVGSLFLFKSAFLDARQRLRLRGDFYTQRYLMSHRQARLLSEFIDGLSESGEKLE